MRQSKMLIPTLREVPSEAEIISHQIMLRAGMIRQLAAGIYTYLPLGYRTLRRIERIVRQEMDKSGAQEIHCSALQPMELWEQSGRASAYGPEMMRISDRHERQFALGPTHEEVFTTHVKNEVRSYRQLPLNLYQIQTKYRDEIRPRFGVMRAREFVMKDAYSFDASLEGLDMSYQAMHDAYHRIFTRVGLNFRAVDADAGAIGGEGGSQEFMALSEIGEDTLAVCTHCSYAANLEKATAFYVPLELQSAGLSPTKEQVSPVKVATPGKRTIEEVSSFLSVSQEQLLKTLLYEADGELVAVVIRGDHEANETKIKNVLGVGNLELAGEAARQKYADLPVGYVGPIGLSDLGIRVLVDRLAASVFDAVVGAGEVGFHLTNVRPGIHFNIDQTYDLRNVVSGEPCPNCQSPLEFYRGIEVGHIFKLGTKYSSTMGAKFLDQDGKEKVIEMGCYGIGVTRVLGTVVEQNYRDDAGLVWPMSITPYHVQLIPVNANDQVQQQIAADLYERLLAAGIDVLWDDRDERPGVKFKDGDLIGTPLRITIGRLAGEGIVEYKDRRSGAVDQITWQDALTRAIDQVKSGIMRQGNEGEGRI
ncbi:MAG: proline--tRNA ligase [Bacilli bacterium]|nr:proline--tRNA ligase [Bacilli bacterium]